MAANNKGFPSNPSQLTSAVRKALFTSATVTAIAVGAPGHNAYAQQAGVCNPISTEFTSGTVQCSGIFDESINYEVKDFTVVDGSEVPNDISVVVAEGSSATGISVAAMPVAGSSEPAEGSVMIENHGDIAQSEGSALEVSENYYVRKESGWGIKRGAESTGWQYTASVALDADGNVVGERADFESAVNPDDIAEFLGTDAANFEGKPFQGQGPVDDLAVIVAPQGTFNFDDQAAIRAETDAGDINIINNGTISMGDGVSIGYFTAYSESISTNGRFTDVDTDGDGVNDTRLYASANQISVKDRDFFRGQQYFTASASTIGVDAKSVSGNIVVENTSTIEAGDISFGVRTHTDSGDISISNSGDIAVGADAVGISAGTAVITEEVATYSAYSDVNSIRVKGSLVDGAYYNHYQKKYNASIRDVDAGNSIIEIANAGSITVGASGTGIEARNPSGELIAIQNSGDITVGAGEGGAGISANAVAGLEDYQEATGEKEVVDTFTVAEGEATQEMKDTMGAFFFNRNGRFYTQEIEVPVESGDGDGTGDGGSVDPITPPTVGPQPIAVAPIAPIAPVVPVVPVVPTEPTEPDPEPETTTEVVDTQHYLVNEIIDAVGYVGDRGDITIVNSGSIDVSAATDASGIHATTLGYTGIENSGQILVGQGGAGIATQGAGETRVINSGDVQLTGQGSEGIAVSSYVYHQLIGNDGISSQAIYGGFGSDELNDAYAGFGGDTTVYNTGTISGDTVLSEVVQYNETGAFTESPNHTRNTGINVVSTGSNLKGTDVGIAMYGPESVDAWNEDKGASLSFRDSIEFFDTTVVNTGEISLGDLSDGIHLSATYGEATIINSGEVSVGDGFVGVREGTYTPARTYSRAIAASPNSISWANNTVINTADGVVTAGDVAQGLVAFSQHGEAMVVNDGSVTVGNGAVLEADEHREEDWGVVSSGIRASAVLGVDNYAGAVNNGTVISGDNTIGMSALNNSSAIWFTSAFEHNYTAAAINTGSVNTGDSSIGLAVVGASSFGYNSGEITIGSGGVQSLDEVFDGAGMSNLGSLTGSMYSGLVNAGTITTGDDALGVDATAFISSNAIQTAEGEIVTGDNTYGMRSIGYYQGLTQNAGSIQTGDNSTGMRSYGIGAISINTGDIEVGADSTGISVVGASTYVNNSGDILTGANGTGIEVISVGSPAVVANTGNITTDGVALNVIGEDYLDQETGQVIPNLIFNSGSITGSIITGDSDDLLRNGFRYDNSGNIAGVGKITLNDAAIDMGAGRNTFINEAGDIVFSGDSVIELGRQGSMVNYSGGANYVTISSLDDHAGDSLTINGDVTFANIQSAGSLFLVDVSSTASDSITINGDLNAVDIVNQAGDTEASGLRVAMNVTDQGKGANTTDAILTVNGEQNVDSVILAGLGGDFADTILEAEMQQDGNGNWVIAYTAGLSDLGAAASSVSHLAESFWMRTASAFFDSERSSNIGESSRVKGLHAWSTMFHTDSDMESRGDVKGQDLAYSQLLSNHMAGATYNTKLGDSWLSISPMVGKGYADGNQLAQQSSAALDTETLAVNATFSLNSFYASAMMQQVDFDARVRGNGAAGSTSGKAHGFSLEGGWTYLLESGIAMTSFAQWDDVKVELDAFTASNANYDYAYDLGNSKRARAGVSLRKSFKLADGFASPYATFSATNINNANNHDLYSNGVRFGSDVAGTGYGIDFGVDGKYKLWTIKSGLGVHTGDTDKNGLSGHFAISRSL